MKAWLGCCGNNNRGGIHPTWKHLPSSPGAGRWSLQPSLPGNLLEFIVTRTNTTQHSSKLPTVLRQQLALVQLVGREWLISISPRAEGRKGTFPFSWAKKSGPGRCLVDLLCEANLPWTGSWCVTLAASFVCTLNSSGSLFLAHPGNYYTRPLQVWDWR